MLRFRWARARGEVDIDMRRVIANLTHIGQLYLLLPKYWRMVDGRLIGGGVCGIW